MFAAISTTAGDLKPVRCQQLRTMAVYTGRLTLVILLLLAGAGSARDEFCCPRTAIFVPIEMPPQQEHNASGMIGAGWYSALREADILGCPIQYEELSYDGRQMLHKYINAVGEVYEVPPDPDAERAFSKLLDCEYVWQATLTLNSISREVKGWYDEADESGPGDYNQGYVEGNWTLHMQLVNVHFGETVEEGQGTWEGGASGYTSDRVNMVKALARSTFSPIDDIIFEYEHIPWSCNIELEVDSIEAGKEITIDVTEILDHQGGTPKPWQRVVVEVVEGELLNGTLCSDDGKKSAFLVGTEDLQVKYRAPQRCEDKNEKIIVHNSCYWGQEWVRPLRATLPAEKLAEKEVEIYDRKVDKLAVSPAPIKARVGEAVSVNLTDIVDVEGKPMEPHERIMVRVKNGKIANGMPKEDFRVFEVGQGTVNVLYQAPDDFTVAWDSLWIHNACVEGEEFFNIVPGEIITWKPVEITAPPIYARITRTVKRTREENVDSTDVGGVRRVVRTKYHSTHRAAVYCTFEEPERKMYRSGFEIKPWRYLYAVKDCRVMSSTYTSNGDAHHAWYDAAGFRSESRTRSTEYGTPIEPDLSPEGLSIELRIDTAAGGGLIHRVSVPSFNVTFSVETDTESKGEELQGDNVVPKKWKDTHTNEVVFSVGPNVDDRDDCKRVTGGDGLNSMTGRCTETRKSTYVTERETFEWAVYVKKD